MINRSSRRQNTARALRLISSSGDVENKLQMVNDAQTHSLPHSVEELTARARRLGYSCSDRGSAAEQFLRDYQHHTSQVNRIFEEVFSAAEPRRFS